MPCFASIIKIHESGHVPIAFKHANIVPIPKPNKIDYRPISLLLTISKIHERLLLSRLKFKIPRLLGRVYGFQDQVSTTDAITLLIDDLSQAKCTRKPLVVFLDLKQAFELAAPWAVLDSLTKYNIKGKLMASISSFLQDRTFSTCFQGTMSSKQTHENGTPQGSILSPFLFNVLMHSFLGLPYRSSIKIYLYADDIAITASKPSARRVTTHSDMTHALTLITNHCNTLGLIISPNKCSAMYIGRKPDNVEPLLIQNQAIPFVTHQKYLGLEIDNRLTFNQHIQAIATRANKRLNIMKAISASSWGANAGILTMFYKAAIRSILEYAAPIHAMTIPLEKPTTSITPTVKSRSKLHSFQIIQNKALRLITGALNTTTVEALHQQTNIKPLHLRIQRSIMRYIHKTTQLPFDHFLKPIISLIHERDWSVWPGDTWRHRMSNIFIHYEYQPLLHTHIPSAPRPPWWTLDATIVTSSVSGLPSHDKKEKVESTIRAIKKDLSGDIAEYYTDGSLQNNGGSGIGVYSQHTQLSYKLSDDTPIYVAELIAISKAVTHALEVREPNILIHSDSLSALNSISKTYPSGPYSTAIRELQELINSFQAHNKTLIFNHVSAHVDIYGNEQADQLAKRAASSAAPVDIQLPYPAGAYLTFLDELSNSKFKDYLNTRGPMSSLAFPLQIITPIPGNISRREHVALQRLRFNSKSYSAIAGQPEPPCKLCDEPYSHIHYLVACPALHMYHMDILQHIASDSHDSDDISKALNILNSPPAMSSLLKMINKHPPQFFSNLPPATGGNT